MPFLAIVNLHISNPLTSDDLVIVLVSTLVAAVAILVVTFAVSRWLSARLRGGLVRSGFQTNVAILLGRGLWATIWAAGILWILYLLGVGLTPLTAFIGIVGLAASLSLQQVLQNLVAGVYLLAEQPFAIGDTISVIGPGGLNHEGRVQDIQMRTTHLLSNDDENILVPNAAIFAGVITNRTAVGGYAAHVTLTFPRQTELQPVREQIQSVLAGMESVLERPQPQLRIDKATKDDWTACLTFWVRTVRDGASDAIWGLARAFPDATINTGGAES